MRPFPLFTLTLILLSTGCKPDRAIQKGEVVDGGTKSAPLAPRGAPQPIVNPGSISGTVAFSGKAPAKVLIDTSMDPACAFSPATVYSEQYVVNAGKLANVFVYVKSGPPAAMLAAAASPAPVVLDQKGCQYTPHVIGVQAGGSVEFHNSDPTMHNIHTLPSVAGNESVDVSQGPRGAPQIKRFINPELMMPVRCNNHPWMNAFLNVSATPFFAVTDASGHFNLSGLPPGNYTLGAVHEKLGEQTLTLTVPPNASATANFTFSMK